MLINIVGDSRKIGFAQGWVPPFAFFCEGGDAMQSDFTPSQHYAPLARADFFFRALTVAWAI